jgi:hypothetical protein
VADEETLVLLKRFSRNPDVERERAEFERAQKAEEKFHKDIDGVDFTKRSPAFKADGPKRKNCGYRYPERLALNYPSTCNCFWISQCAPSGLMISTSNRSSHRSQSR